MKNHEGKKLITPHIGVGDELLRVLLVEAIFKSDHGGKFVQCYSSLSNCKWVRGANIALVDTTQTATNIT